MTNHKSRLREVDPMDVDRRQLQADTKHYNDVPLRIICVNVTPVRKPGDKWIIGPFNKCVYHMRQLLSTQGFVPASKALQVNEHTYILTYTDRLTDSDKFDYTTGTDNKVGSYYQSVTTVDYNYVVSVIKSVSGKRKGMYEDIILVSDMEIIHMST